MSAAISGVVLSPKNSLRISSFVLIVAAAKPDSARTPGPTVYGPCRTPQAPSVAASSPLNVNVWIAFACLTRVVAKLSVRFVRARIAPVRALTIVRKAIVEPDRSSTIAS